MKYLAIPLILLAIPSVAAVRSFIPEDYYSIQTLEDPQISPDGRLVAYTLRSIDARQNRPLTDIWIVPTDGSREASQVTTAGSSPRWSPDSRTLAYIAVRRDPHVEPTAAAAPAAIRSLFAEGTIAREERVVVILTGNGLKATDKIVAHLGAAASSTVPA